MTRTIWLWIGIVVVGAHACTLQEGVLLDVRPKEEPGSGGQSVSATDTVAASGGAVVFRPPAIITSGITTEPPPPTICDDTMSPCECNPNGGTCMCQSLFQMECGMTCPSGFSCQMGCLADSLCNFSADWADAFCEFNSTCYVTFYVEGTVFCQPFATCTVYGFGMGFPYIYCDEGAVCDCPTQNCVCDGPGCPTMP